MEASTTRYSTNVAAYDSRAVANSLLKIAKENHSDLDPLKLQKLIFIAHGFYLGNTGKPFILDRIEAWPYGPVIPTLYHEFKFYRAERITEYYMPISNPRYPVSEPPMVNEADEMYLRKLWTLYGQYSGPELSNLLHQEGTPWDTIYNQRNIPPSFGSAAGREIPNEIIRGYYSRLLSESK